MMAPGHERGLGFLRNVAIDQHLVARHREADLAQVVAAHPELLGIGIDKSTAIVVRGNTLTVIGRNIVAITDGATHDWQPYYTLSRGERFDLATWSVMPGPP
jgi:cyanophycinase